MDLADIALIKLHKEEVSSQGALAYCHDDDDDEIVKITFPNETSVIKRKADINASASDCFNALRDTLLQGYIDPELGREYNVNRLKQFALLNTGYPSIPLKGICTTSQMQYFMRMWDTQKHMRWENKMTNLFGQLLSLIDNDNVEGVKGLWELAMRDECLPFFTDDVLAALVDSFEESEQEEVHWCAAGAIWALCRHFHVLGGLVTSGCVGAMIKRIGKWDPKKLPSRCAETFSGAFSVMVQNKDARIDMTDPAKLFTGTQALLLLCSKNRGAAEALCNCLPDDSDTNTKLVWTTGYGREHMPIANGR